jgi:hypothetical protein
VEAVLTEFTTDETHCHITGKTFLIPLLSKYFQTVRVLKIYKKSFNDE